MGAPAFQLRISAKGMTFRIKNQCWNYRIRTSQKLKILEVEREGYFPILNHEIDL